MFKARVINLCDRDIATNFGAVAGEVILVDSYACTVIFICCDSKKKRIFACCGTVHYGSGTVQNRFFGEIRYRSFFFLKGNDVLNRATGKPLAPPYRGQIPLFSSVFRQF